MAHTKEQLAAKYQELAAQERDRVAAAGGDVARFNELAVNDLNSLRGREDVRTLRNEVDQAYYDAAMRRQDAKGGKSSARRPQPPITSGRDGRRYGSAGAGASAKELEELRAKHRKEENEQQARLARDAAEHRAALDMARDEAVLDRRSHSRGWSTTALSARASGGSVKIKGTSRSGWTQGASRARAARDVIGTGASDRGAGRRPSVGVRVSDDWWAPVDMGSYYDADGKVVTRRYEGGDLGDMNFPRGNGRFQGGVLDPSFISRTTADLMGDMDPSSPGYDRAYQRARSQAREMHAAGMEAFRSWARWAREARDRDDRDRRLAARKSRSERAMDAAAAPVVRPEKPVAQAPAAQAPVDRGPSPVDGARLDREIAAGIRAPYSRDEDYAPFDAGAAAASLARKARAEVSTRSGTDGGAPVGNFFYGGDADRREYERIQDSFDRARRFREVRDALTTPAELEYRKQRAKDDEAAALRAADEAKNLYLARHAASKGGSVDEEALDKLAAASDTDLEVASDPRRKFLDPESPESKFSDLRKAAGVVGQFSPPSTGVTSSRPIVDRRGNVIGLRELYRPDEKEGMFEYRTQRDWAARGVGGYLPSAARNTMRLARDRALTAVSAAMSTQDVPRSPDALRQAAKDATMRQARAAAAKMVSGKYKMNLAGMGWRNASGDAKALFGPTSAARDRILESIEPTQMRRALIQGELDAAARRAADARRRMPSPYDEDAVAAARNLVGFVRGNGAAKALADVGRTIARGFAADARSRDAQRDAMNASYDAYAAEADARHRAGVQADRRGPADQFGPLPPDEPAVKPREVHIRTLDGKYGPRYFSGFLRWPGKSISGKPAKKRR